MVPAVTTTRDVARSIEKNPIQRRLPQPDAASDARFVGDSGHIGRQLEIDPGGIAAAEVQVIEIEQCSDDSIILRTRRFHFAAPCFRKAAEPTN